MVKPRLLTGDTPTGGLHLGHWVGSVENRVQLQDDYDCYFLIANKHAFTTRAERPDDVRRDVLQIATEWLAAGIDPARSTLFVQSEVPAIDELTFFFAMLLPFNRVMRNPTWRPLVIPPPVDDQPGERGTTAGVAPSRGSSPSPHPGCNLEPTRRSCAGHGRRAPRASRAMRT
jgi:hypothetical protein